MERVPRHLQGSTLNYLLGAFLCSIWKTKDKSCGARVTGQAQSQCYPHLVSCECAPSPRRAGGHMRVEYREYLFMVEHVVTGPQPIWGWEVQRQFSGHIVAHGRADSPRAASDAARLCIDLQSAARASATGGTARR